MGENGKDMPSGSILGNGEHKHAHQQTHLSNGLLAAQNPRGKISRPEASAATLQTCIELHFTPAVSRQLLPPPQALPPHLLLHHCHLPALFGLTLNLRALLQLQLELKPRL
jgi:hypothetical protein